MLIKDNDQGGGGNISEVYDIFDGNLIEIVLLLGKGSIINCYVECIDCYNLYWVICNIKIDGMGVIIQCIYIVGGLVGLYMVELDGNVVLGVLCGIWGVELVDGLMIGMVWFIILINFIVKSGVIGVGMVCIFVWLMWEYQFCFKCYLNYSNIDGFFLFLCGNIYGGIVSGINGMINYINVVVEFVVNVIDLLIIVIDQGEKGEGLNSFEDGVGIELIGFYLGDVYIVDMIVMIGVNYCFWYLVCWLIGCSCDECCMQFIGGNFWVFFGIWVGMQIMYCFDCYGNGVLWIQGIGLDLVQVQGLYGLIDNFLLKGSWLISILFSSFGFCGNCYNLIVLLGSGDIYVGFSGFNNLGEDGGGGYGNEYGGKVCVKCYIVVLYGW